MSDKKIVIENKEKFLHACGYVFCNNPMTKDYYEHMWEDYWCEQKVIYFVIYKNGGCGFETPQFPTR